MPSRRVKVSAIRLEVGGSVRASPDGLACRRPAANRTAFRRLRGSELCIRDQPDRRLRFFLGFGLACRVAAPSGIDEPAVALDDLPEPRVVGHATVTVLLAA